MKLVGAAMLSAQVEKTFLVDGKHTASEASGGTQQQHAIAPSELPPAACDSLLHHTQPDSNVARGPVWWPTSSAPVQLATACQSFVCPRICSDVVVLSPPSLLMVLRPQGCVLWRATCPGCGLLPAVCDGPSDCRSDHADHSSRWQQLQKSEKSATKICTVELIGLCTAAIHIS